MSRSRSVRPILLIACAAAVLAPGVVQAASGEFTFVVGDVRVVKTSGRVVQPLKGTTVDPGDVVATGANAMAQLNMLDMTRLSLRPNTQLRIEAYPERRGSTDSAVLRLVKGTLRTFTGLIASANRDNFVMKTRVATVGIRGSGNILYACDGEDCDPSLAGAGRSEPVTINHTIEGAHAITNVPLGAAAQQAVQTLVTGPGQTAIVLGSLPPRYIPTPAFIAESATSMTGGAKSTEAAASEETRDFAPGDTPALPPAQTAATPIVGTTPFPDAASSIEADALGLHDVILAIGAPLSGQATRGDVDIAGNAFRSYRSYAGTQSNVQPAIIGGRLRDTGSVATGGGDNILFGHWQDVSLGFFGPGAGSPIAGGIHWIVAPSGHPAYLSDVLTGRAAYTLAGHTSPTNQLGTVGTLGSATLNVDFTDRSVDLLLSVSVPASGGVAGGQWQVSAERVPLALNAFFATTEDRVVITNGTAHSSRSTGALSGSVEGSLVGNGLTGAILGYGISDGTASTDQRVSGVAAFTGSRQNAAAPYREGRVSDPEGALAEFIRSYATTNRPDEVTADSQGRVTAFSAPILAFGGRSAYALGTAQVLESGVDTETGLNWGRWGDGIAQVTRGGETRGLNLHLASLHYIFAGAQSGPVSLPLTGTAIYDVIGSTHPTDSAGNVGTFNSASLNANFSARTLDASVSIGINGQTWTGSAANIPIYRDQYFSAYAGTPIPGLPNPSPLVIGCTPNCGHGATGSFDGFFTGRTGQRAGMMYDLGDNQGAVAFGRRGGGG